MVATWMSSLYMLYLAASLTGFHARFRLLLLTESTVKPVTCAGGVVSIVKVQVLVALFCRVSAAVRETVYVFSSKTEPGW